MVRFLPASDPTRPGRCRNMCGCGLGTRGRGRGVIVCCRCISRISRACPLSRQRTKAIDRDRRAIASGLPRTKSKQVFAMHHQAGYVANQPQLVPWRAASVFNQPSAGTQLQLRTRVRRARRAACEQLTILKFPLPLEASCLRARGGPLAGAFQEVAGDFLPVRARRELTRACEQRRSTARGIRTPARAPRRCRSSTPAS